MILGEFSFSEHGNVALSSSDGAELLWIIDGDYAVMEVAFCADNYPAWRVATLRLPVADLAKHINENLQAWHVRKGNIDGLNELVRWRLENPNE